MRAKLDSPFRQVGLFVALFAITLNFLQPLAHAAAMRDGPASALWTVFCKSAAATEPRDADAPAPMAAAPHDCCLGLAHAAAVASPPAAFVVLAPLAGAAAPLQPAPRLVAAGLRDGPPRPRGPPFIA